MPAAGSYSREQSSPLYTLVTAGRAVEVSSNAAGRAVMVESGLAVGRAARVCSFSYKQSSKCRLAAGRAVSS